ncbi:MAG: CRISPR-associated endonuclease Cas3'', partial [Hyphomicrobiales bacterium]|nr:CRISPR-associated endonuclease Cas3'' [Hyphomicrobiales bacterium]
MIYFAHSGTPGDKSDWQLLRDHLVGTAGIAAAMGEPLGLKKAVYIAGLLHDLGKFTREFQKRLEGGKPVDHSTAGARLLLDLCKPQERFVAELCAYAILGHHAGLPDRQASEDSRGSCMNDRLEAFTEWPDEIWKSELVLDTAGMAPQGFSYKRLLQENAFTLSVMGRMIFSCLVDADFRDTEAFY